MEESKGFYVATSASGEDPVGEYYEYAGDKIFNLQLRYWAEAVEKFKHLYAQNFKHEELVLIMNCLCNSLEALAGVNIRPPKNNRTPSLLELYTKTLKDERKWDLKSEEPQLFKELEGLVEYHNNICKHLNRSPVRKDLLRSVSYEGTCKYMSTTQNIWLWILGKKFKGKRLKEQRRFFEYDFSEWLKIFQESDPKIPDIHRDGGERSR